MNKLTDETKTNLESQFEKHSKRFEENMKNLETQNKLIIATDISYEFESGLKIHKKIIEKLARAPFGTYVPKEGEKVENFSADLKFDQAVKIAKMKMDSMRTDNLKKAVKQVVASCVSLGVHVDGKHPKEILKEIDSGKFDSRIV